MTASNINAISRIARAGTRFSILLLLLTTGATNLCGQVKLTCRLPQPQTLLYAPTQLEVQLANNTGRTLLLDGGRLDADLRLDVERLDGRLMSRVSEDPLVQDEALLPGATRTFIFDIERLFEIHQLGTYKIRAILELGQELYASPDITLYVVRGFELANLKAGVPGDPDALRTYKTEYLQTDAGEVLFLRIEDERKNAVFGVFELGKIVRVRAPELMLDEVGNLHILFQSKNASYIHTTFTPYGVRLLSETIPTSRMDINLQRDDAGGVQIHFNPAQQLPPTTLPPPENTKKRKR